DALGETRLAAYVIPDGAHDPSPAALHAHLARTLPDFMIPAHFVVMDAFPKTPSGKIDRKALPLPSLNAGQAGLDEREPTWLEGRLVVLWRELLNVERVGLHDDFFALGGHSLLVLRLLARVERALGVRLTPAVLFQAPTVAQLAAHIQQGTPAVSSLVALNASGLHVPLLCVPGQNGNAMHFSQLTKALGPDYPVFAYQHPAYDPANTRRFDSLSDLAAYYVRLAEESHLTRQVCLMGASIGGKIALEMARQIAEAGAPPPIVVLVDTYYDRFAFERRTANQRHARREAPPPSEPLLIALRKRWYRLRRTLSKAVVALTDPEVRTVRRVKRATLRISRLHEVQPYAGRIVYLLCREDLARPDLKGLHDLDAWQKAAQGGFTLLDLPGDHLNTLEAPHVEVTAGHLRALLAEIEAG
ncbi:MAG: alpha/beta fold hydrolase, partial [Chloroflexi bacterium]|nr:alpha/beta fold hydrolase [Chloroflexota bacterium]